MKQREIIQEGGMKIEGTIEGIRVYFKRVEGTFYSHHTTKGHSDTRKKAWACFHADTDTILAHIKRGATGFDNDIAIWDNAKEIHSMIENNSWAYARRHIEKGLQAITK